MAEEIPEPPDAIRKLELQARLASFDGRAAREEKILEDIETLFREVDGLIPQLPPMSSDEPITDAQHNAQEGIIERYNAFYQLGQLMLFENMELKDGQSFLDVPYTLFEGKVDDLETLTKEGIITPQQRLERTASQMKRSSRMVAGYHRWGQIMFAHREQIYRKS